VSSPTTGGEIACHPQDAKDAEIRDAVEIKLIKIPSPDDNAGTFKNNGDNGGDKK
jgi:hypothetical protein